MNNREKKKKFNPGALIAIAVLILARDAELFGTILGAAIVLAIFLSPFLILYFVIRKSKGRSSPGTPARKEPAFDDCPQPLFCFHRDKGDHHVRKGKEIDPWDRPDIDISKYQRKR